MKLLSVLVAVLITVSLAGALDPGFKVTLTKTGLNYASSVAMQYLQQKFATVHVADQSGDAHAPVIGKVEWKLSNIVISGLHLPESNIGILPGKGVSVKIGDAALNIKMDFHYREKHWPHIKGHGSLTISASRMNIDVQLEVGASGGRPSVKVLESSCNIGDLKVKEHGGPSWLINFFLKVLHTPIRKAAEKAVGNAIEKLLNDAGNRAVQSIPMQESFGGIAEVDYSLVANPTFGASYLTINAKGEFYYLPHKTESPYKAKAMPDEVNGEMMQIMVSDYVVDSASYVFRESGKMTHILNEHNLPSWAPIHLNTTSWAHILPELAKKYPNKQMQAELTTTSPPTAAFSTSGVRVSGPGQIVMSVLDPNPVPVFALNIDVSTSSKVWVSHGRIFMELAYLDSPVTVAYSHVGTINLGELDHIIKSLCTNAIVPFFNYYLSHGINIPTIKDLTLVKPSVVYGNGYVAVTSNIHYAI